MEGSIMADKTVNSLSHYTDWTVAHVHSGSLGWVAMITIGSLYAMAPAHLGRTEMHSKSHVLALLAAFDWHVALCDCYVGGGYYRRLDVAEIGADGTLLYSFLDSLVTIKPLYVVRALGGTLVLTGMAIMAWNMWKTSADARQGKVAPIPVPVDDHGHGSTQTAHAY